MNLNTFTTHLEGYLRRGYLCLIHGYNHGGGNVRMPQQLLHGANIVSARQQMRGKTMAQSMRRGKLNQTCQFNRFFNRTLHCFFICMMAANHFAQRINL